MARRHLAVFLKSKEVEEILSGKRQVELRLSESRILPYGQIQKDDEIYLKVSGEKILGKVEVENVLFYDKLNEAMLRNLKREYFETLELDEKFWQDKEKSSYATIIFLKNPKKFLAPVVFSKHDRRPWVIMEEYENRH